MCLRNLMFKPKRLLIVPLIVLAVGVIVLKLLSFTGSAPVRGEAMTRLPVCPPSPNCVCSQDPDEAHSVAAIRYVGNPAEAWDDLQRRLTDLGGKPVANDGGHYARYEFRSRIFGFVDDVECLLNKDEMRIEIRSASRSGYSDLGANRRRVERIRTQFAKFNSGVTSPE